MNSATIAKLAGVSRSTVSRVVNNYANVQEETRQRVLRIIEQYDYEPNTFAQALVGKPTKTVGLFIIGFGNKDVPTRIHKSGYFAPFMEVIVDAVSAYGYFTMTRVLNSEAEYENIKQAFLQKRIDCAILLGTRKAADIYGVLLNKGYPLVIIDIDPYECRKFRSGKVNLSIINSMNYEGAYEAVEYLIGLGHREIGFITGLDSTFSGRERYRAYMDAMKNHNLPIKDKYVIQGNFNSNEAVPNVINLVEKKDLPTAIFSCNDDMALSVIEAIKQYGIRVPEDISIIGFDDIYITSHTNPRLTTVNVPIIEMAKKAAEATINAIEKTDRCQILYNLPTELIIRESCASRA